MTTDRCPSCGILYTQHYGLNRTCRELLEARAEAKILLEENISRKLFAHSLEAVRDEAITELMRMTKSFQFEHSRAEAAEDEVLRLREQQGILLNEITLQVKRAETSDAEVDRLQDDLSLAQAKTQSMQNYAEAAEAKMLEYLKYNYGKEDCLGCQERDAEVERLRETIKIAPSCLGDNCISTVPAVCAGCFIKAKDEIRDLEAEAKQMQEENAAWQMQAKRTDLQAAGHDPLTIALRNRAEAAEAEVERLLKLCIATDQRYIDEAVHSNELSDKLEAAEAEVERYKAALAESCDNMRAEGPYEGMGICPQLQEMTADRDRYREALQQIDRFPVLVPHYPLTALGQIAREVLEVRL